MPRRPSPIASKRRCLASARYAPHELFQVASSPAALENYATGSAASGTASASGFKFIAGLIELAVNAHI